MKLLRVVANDFKLCGKDFTISFVPLANKSKDDIEFELQKIDEDLYTFNTVGIVGKNASGKTTTTELLSIVYDIFSNYRILLSSNRLTYVKKPFNIDVTFYHEGVIYRYLTDICDNEDSLSLNTLLFKNEKLYKREYKKSHSKDLFEYDKYDEVVINKLLPEDTSILYDIFKNTKQKGICFSCNEININYYPSIFKVCNLMSNNKNIINLILQMFDDSIKNIEILDGNKFKITYKNNSYKNITNIELNQILSSGTNKGLGLFTYVVYSLQNGTDLIIDEIENHFHKTLVENIINLYKDKSVNKHNATLIFTTHYCEMLDLFSRSDNVYISKKKECIELENMYTVYKYRNDLLKSNGFYNNEFDTKVDYDALMNFKKALME